jgi:lysophospholipid acyltransferase (LPLAT)-like uncharacterized protein
MALRIDTAPWFLKPVVAVYGYVLGHFQYFHYWINHRTIRISWIGRENICPDKNYIFVYWHRYFPCYFSAFFHFKQHAWMVHPLLYMVHMWVLVRLLGVQKLIPGSTGNDGYKAACELIEALKSGYSTMICPDGPSGPSQVLKKGVLHIAAKSRVQIVPLHFTPKPSIWIRSWDKKLFPIPFGHLEVKIGQPIEVTTQNQKLIETALTSALNGE